MRSIYQCCDWQFTKRQHQTPETHHQIQTSRKKRSWTPKETMAMRRCRNRSNDLIHGGRRWWWSSCEHQWDAPRQFPSSSRKHYLLIWRHPMLMECSETLQTKHNDMSALHKYARNSMLDFPQSCKWDTCRRVPCADTVSVDRWLSCGCEVHKTGNIRTT